MLKNIIDEGQKFDFGKTSKFYAKHRDIYPEELFDRLHKIGIGTEGSQWLDLGTGTGVVPRGMAKYGADIIATDISENQKSCLKEWIISNTLYHLQRILIIRIIVLMLLLLFSAFGILIQK